MRVAQLSVPAAWLGLSFCLHSTLWALQHTQRQASPLQHSRLCALYIVAVR